MKEIHKKKKKNNKTTQQTSSVSIKSQKKVSNKVCVHLDRKL